MKHLVDPPNNALAQRLIGEGFSCIAALTASNMTAHLFQKGEEKKIVLTQKGITELYKET